MTRDENPVTAAGGKLRRKSESSLWRFVARIWKNSERYTTTFGRTVWLGAGFRFVAPGAEAHLRHEAVHVRQWRRWGPWFSISYALLPLPAGLAWFRWAWEREAYLENLRDRPTIAHVEHIVEALWRDYGRCWPRSWMRAWFLKGLTTC